METCEHGAIWSPTTHRTNLGCCVREFPPDPGPALSDDLLRAYREIGMVLTQGHMTVHKRGRLRVAQYHNISQGQFIENMDNGRALWQALWGSGPATEALALAPHAIRDLIREVDRLRALLKKEEEK